jgi:CBS-domain-containing membrane protein
MLAPSIDERLLFKPDADRRTGIRAIHTSAPGRYGGIVKAMPVTDAQSMPCTATWVTIAPDAPLTEAAARMGEQKIGCLPVVADGEFVGILSPRVAFSRCCRRAEASCAESRPVRTA